MAAFDPESVERFRRDFQVAAGPGCEGPIGLAVSGGPDSLALLLLASVAWPQRVRAATVDHGLRRESAGEAVFVSEICARLGVPHRTLKVQWPEPPVSNVQAAAREARYAALAAWAGEEGIACIATAHHLDDQAETLLMRLARGAGLAGLAGVRAHSLLCGLPFVRPLLGWRKAELAEIVRVAGIAAIEDPSNQDERFDRTHARALLAGTDWPVPERLAAAAANLADAEEAVQWISDRYWSERTVCKSGTLILDPEGLPREIQRRMLVRALKETGGGVSPRGPQSSRLLDSLRDGGGGTLNGVHAVCAADKSWRFSPAPPRR